MNEIIFIVAILKDLEKIETKNYTSSKNPTNFCFLEKITYTYYGPILNLIKTLFWT